MGDSFRRYENHSFPFACEILFTVWGTHGSLFLDAKIDTNGVLELIMGTRGLLEATRWHVKALGGSWKSVGVLLEALKEPRGVNSSPSERRAPVGLDFTSLFSVGVRGKLGGRS